MKTAIIAMFVGLAGDADTEKLITAIEQAENTPWTAPGGGLQFTVRTWREETKRPYTDANLKPVAKAIAAQRLQRYARKLHTMGIEPTPYLMGSIWNKGFTGAMNLRRDKRKCKYGERVQNLFEALKKAQP
jgi:hypothetical protein